MEPLKGILVFSAIETVTVVAWGAILGIGSGLTSDVQVLAAGVLFVGYVIEHIVAFNVGKDRPYLSFPRR
jgi:hypothetical protein